MTISFGSVCSGIESASVALEPIGFKACWFSEIEPFPCAVLKYHWPNTPNFGDMNNLPEMIRRGDIEAPEMIIGGTPCQAFSIAGKGESLSDARGGLSLIYGDLLNAIDEQRQGNECVAVWENVPGVLSTKDNAFGWFLGLLAGEYALADCLGGRAEPLEAQPGASRQKWPKSGCVIGPVRTVAWRVIDAQYFGLAQRRKRVFVVASARKGFDSSEVLFEREGVRRDSAPSRETKQNITGELRAGSQIIARTLLGKGNDSMAEGLDTHTIEGHRMVAFGEYATDETASTMKARDYKSATDLVVHGTQAPCVSKNLAFALGRNNDRENVICIQGATIGRSDTAGPQGVGVNDNISFTLTATDRHAVSYPSARRLTEIECERLQGFPDGHTDVPWARGNSDHRYKAIGNSKATNCVKWLGLRIKARLEALKAIKMNQYAKTLTEIKSKPSHKLKEIGDQWETPKAIAWGLFSTFNARLGSIVIDIFADDCNALLPNYYTAADNALTQNLAADLRKIGGSAAYGNPPYSRSCFDDDENAITGMEYIIDWCRKQREEGAKIMLLIKAATSESWWPEDADFIQFIKGRVGFEAPDWFVPETAKDKPSSAGFPSAVVIFDKSWAWERRPIERLSRDDLIAQGNVILEMMNKQVAA